MMSLCFIADAAVATATKNAIKMKEPQWMRAEDSALVTSGLTVSVTPNTRDEVLTRPASVHVHVKGACIALMSACIALMSVSVGLFLTSAKVEETPTRFRTEVTFVPHQTDKSTRIRHGDAKRLPGSAARGPSRPKQQRKFLLFSERKERKEGRGGIDNTKTENGHSDDGSFSAALASLLICSVDYQHTHTHKQTQPHTHASHP